MATRYSRPSAKAVWASVQLTAQGTSTSKASTSAYVTMNQLSVGLQAGGQAFSQIIFFEHKGAFDDFTKGNFEFDATVQAVAIKASATASAGTTGASTGAATGGGKKEATSAGTYRKGMAVFTVAKGGLMYQAAVGGQKFKYKANK